MAFETINLGTQPTGTGGDTARSAFEKVNKNFITAEVLASSMSQAQFEAIRTQNNEEYAASGFVHFGKHYNLSAGFIAINEGLWTATSEANILRIGRYSTDGVGESKAQNPHVNIAGVLTELSHLSYPDSVTNRIKLPQAPDGKTTYNKSTGANTVHSTTTAAFNAAGADPTNVEVVTDRVDMWGFESWLEEVSVTNPYIYPNGLIQSLATTMDGIATSASNRPDTYYAWFDGDAGSKGKGVNYFTLTDAQKRKVLANHKNKLYFLDDGRLVQWRVRGRSFAGAGNGDWKNIISSDLSSSTLMFDNFLNRVTPQGSFDSKPAFNNAVDNYVYPVSNLAVNPSGAIGVFCNRNSNMGNGINGECYFLVCGTVNRLNQGAYHPSFNPSGTARLFSATQDTNFGYWYDSGRKEVTSASQLFIVGSYPNTGLAGFAYRGDISANVSGRPDGRFYDAIYASGQGGVCRDMRYSANHTTLEKFAEADLKVKNGTYRGFEEIKFTDIYTSNATSSLSTSNGVFVTDTANWSIGDEVSIVKDGVVLVPRAVISSVSPNASVAWDGNYYGTYNRVSGQSYLVVHTKKLASCVGGSYLQTDVIGAPSSILLTDALKNGWYGSWVPDLPAGGGKPHYGTRKNINVTGSPLLTSNNNGATWDSFPTGTQAASVLNGTTGSYATTEIRICQYQAFAKQTESSANDAVYGGEAGVGLLYISSDNRGAFGSLLCESSLDFVCKNQAYMTNASMGLIRSNVYAHNSSFAKGEIAQSPTHSQIPAIAASNPRGFKALNYNTEKNQQAGINYAATELVYKPLAYTALTEETTTKSIGTLYKISNGRFSGVLVHWLAGATSPLSSSGWRIANGYFMFDTELTIYGKVYNNGWGDDSQIHIVDGENTLTDLNGKTVKVVTHKLKEPIGWIKNTV